MKEKISITVEKSILKNIDSTIDRIFIRNRSQAIESLLKTSFDKEKVAVILLGGPEERLKIGKEYVPSIKIKDNRLIEIQIKKLREYNFRKIYIIGRKNLIKEVFSIVKNGEDYGIKIEFVEEISAEGSAESLGLLKNKIKTSFLVLFGDIIFDDINLDKLWYNHIKKIPISTLNLITYGEPSEKGEVFMEEDKVVNFIQKPKTKDTYLVFSPIFVCEPELLQYQGKSLERDVFPLLAKKGVLNGYVSAKREIHIHSKKDIIEFNKNRK
ncbi:MAG: nucleotidyltransferase family protein [Nanobdellota archaeon]